MKKRLVSIIVVMILLVSMLSGCGLITLNAERDGAQVVSTVDVDGLHGVVTKADLVGMFNQVGFLYIQYYGWTPDKVVNELVTQLSNREILLLNAVNVIAKEQGVDVGAVKKANNNYVENVKLEGTNKYQPNLKPYDLFNLMRPDEQFYVINQTNKSLEESYKKVVEEVKAEVEANAPIEEEEDKKPEEDKKDEEKELAPRTQKTPAADAGKYERDDSITAEAVAGKKSFFADMDEKVKNNKEKKELTEIEVKAYDRFKKNIEKNYKHLDDKGFTNINKIDIAWNAMLDGQKESRLLEKYREEVVNKDIKATEEEVIRRYTFQVSNDLTTVFDKDSYKTAIDADKEHNLLVHNNETGYFTVKSILLQFSEDQKKALDAIKGGILCDSNNYAKIAEYRDELAINSENFGIVGLGDNIGGIKVNVSNPDYDPNAVCKEENCPCKACVNHKDHKKGDKCDVTDGKCPCVACVNNAYNRKKVDFKTILDEMSLDLAKAESGLLFGAKVAEEDKAAARLNAKMDKFDDYIYLVNDDPGMFNSTGYIMNNKGESQYVAEYVALARALAEKNEIGAVGGLVGDAEYKDIANPFDDKKPAIRVHKAKVEGGEEINYIVNDFGIHIVMVTYIAGEDEGNTTTKFTAEDNLYKLNLNYVTKYENVYKTDDNGKVVLDENGNKTVVEVKNKTVGDRLGDAITEEKKNANYSKVEKEVTDKYSKKIAKNDKLIDKVLKDIEKELKEQGYDPDHNHEGHNHNH